MKKIFLLFIFGGITIGTIKPCLPILYGYFKHEGEMFYGSSLSLDPERSIRLIGVDTTGFRYKRFDSHYYASNEKQVFYKGRAIEGLNPKTARLLGGANGQINKDGYVKDDQNVYYKGEKVENADAESFEIIDSNKFGEDGVGKDKNNIYLGDTFLTSEIGTFQLLEEGYSFDRNNVYYYGNKLLGADPKLVRHQEHYFLMSNNKIFLNGTELTQYDFKTFEIIEIISWSGSCGRRGYSGSMVKDKNGIYLNNSKTALDLRTFKKVTGLLVKDKRGYYKLVSERNTSTNASEYKFIKISLSQLKEELEMLNPKK